jgi:hypothetical protein
VNGEFIKAADYYFHARELNTAAWSRAIFPEALPSLERFADP